MQAMVCVPCRWLMRQGQIEDTRRRSYLALLTLAPGTVMQRSGGGTSPLSHLEQTITKHKLSLLAHHERAMHEVGAFVKNKAADSSVLKNFEELGFRV